MTTRCHPTGKVLARLSEYGVENCDFYDPDQEQHEYECGCRLGDGSAWRCCWCRIKGWEVEESVGALVIGDKWVFSDDWEPLPDDDPRLDSPLERALNEAHKRYIEKRGNEVHP